MGAHTGDVLILNYDGANKLAGIWAVKIRAVPMSISFTGLKGNQLYAFGLNDGTM